MLAQLTILGCVLATQGPTNAEPPEVLIEVRTARALGLEVDSDVYASTLTSEERLFRVAGIYRRAADPATVTLEDYRAIFHLPDLQALLGARDRVDRFTVELARGAEGAGSSVESAAARRAAGEGAAATESHAAPVAAEIERLAYGAEVHPTAEVAAATSETFRVVSRFHRALSGITIAGSAIFLLCLVVLKFEERRMEAATLREIGISRRTLFTWTFLETVVMATLGTAIGLALGWIGSAVVNAYFRAVYDTSLSFARVSPSLAGRVALLALATGVVIGIWAGWRMVRTRPGRLRGT